MLTIEHIIDLDIKHETSIWTPTIMRGDSAVLLFRAHDNNSNESLKKFDKAELTLVMPSGITITENCVKQELRGIDLARFEFKKIHSIEIGTYQIYLTLIQGTDRVSVPPFPIKVDDNASQEDYAFMEIIKGLEEQLAEIAESINKGVPLDSINVADGVAGLDSMKKIPQALLLDYFDKHITTAMYKDGAHGFKLDETTKRPWVLVDGTWKEAKYSDKPMGAGSPIPIPTIIVKNGYAIASFAEPVNLSLRKWTYGLQNIAWFKTNGTTVSTNTFPVSQIGEHTFYYKLADGRENTVAFQVTKEGLDSGTTRPIEDFNDGDIIKFAGLEWIVIDKSKKMLQSRFSVRRGVFSTKPNEKYDPSNPSSSLAYWLNNDFYNSLPASDKGNILNSSWNNGADNNEPASTVNAPVGIMTFSQANNYSKIHKNLVKDGEFFLMTGSQNDPNQVWYLKNIDNSPSAELVEKTSFIGDARPLIYLQSGTLVEPITKDENIPLSQLEDGDMVKFSDKRWRVLDKAQGLIIYDDIPIYRGMKNIWESFLNGSFYLSLSGQAKMFIQANDWDTSKVAEVPMSSKVSAYVGLLSLSMFNTYKNKLSHLIESKMFWTSTIGNLNGLQVAINTTDGYFGNYVQVSEDFDYQIVPIVKVSQNATFGKLKEETVDLSTIKKGQQVWLSNYPWIKGNNNDLILNYNYRMDAEPVKVPFSGDAGSDYFSIMASREGTTNNASKDVNTKFLMERLFYRVYKNLIDKEFNIGFADNPTSQKGFFKAGLINTNTWVNDYKDSLTELKIEEDFWLLNPQSPDNAYFVNARGLGAEIASSSNVNKLTKPVLRLDPSSKVQIISKDETKYAYIPDPIVRMALNASLGKGNITDEITVEEMSSITFFDSVILTTASDLTGLELLVNCTWIRAAHTETGFGITDFSPLSVLGNNPKFKRISFYGVPEGSPTLAVYNQLKGKFPYLDEGGIYTNGHEKVLISQAELMGLTEGVYLQLRNFYTANTSAGNTHLSLKARSYSKTPITHFKPWNSSTFVQLPEPTWDFDLTDYETSWMEIPVSFDGTDTTLYTMTLKDGSGNEESFFYKVDALYHYYWSGRDKKPVLSKTRAQGQNQTVVTLPATVNGLTIESFGSMMERPFWSVNSVTSLTIPVTYKSIGQVFYAGDRLEKLYIHNDSIAYLDRASSFAKSVNGTDLTIYGRQGSTTQEFYQFKISAENNIPQVAKNKYKFALLS